MHKLIAKDLVKTIKGTEIVRGMSLEVNSGEVVGLLGPNGAGKTTSFYMICGLVEMTSGEVFLDGEDISHMPLHQRAIKGIGYLPQEASIFKDLTVEENLMVAAQVNIKDEKAQYERIEELLDMFNIEPIRYRKGISLSGGERRRAEIARALINSPRFLLLDEPFAGVDPLAVSDIQEVIHQLVQYDIGVLITDHNVRETLAITDRSYIIREGQILVHGVNKSPADLTAEIPAAGTIVVDSLVELDRLATMMPRIEGPAPNLWLRLRPGLAVDTHSHTQTGQEDSKFGMGEAEALEAIRLCRAHDLPLTGLSASADGSYIKYDGSSFYDFSVRASYTTPWHLGVDIGYRRIKLDLDDFDDSFADVEFDGPYAGAYLHF